VLQKFSIFIRYEVNRYTASIAFAIFIPLLLISSQQADAVFGFEFEFGSLGSGPGQFDDPFGITTDSNDRIIVSDTNNHRIQVFDSTGAPQFEFGSLGSAPGQFDFPSGVTTDSNDRIIVADTLNNRIQVFDSTGAPQFEFGSAGSGPGQFNFPNGVTTNSNDRIIVADTNNHRIQVFDSAGVFQSEFGEEGMIGQEKFSLPKGVTTDSNDKIIVADSNNHRIVVLDPTASFEIRRFGTFGSGPGQFFTPIGVTTDSNNGIIVADVINNRIQGFDSAGVFQFEFGSAGAGPGQFDFPSGVTTDSNDRIIVADTDNNRIQVFVDLIVLPVTTGQNVNVQTQNPVTGINSISLTFDDVTGAGDLTIDTSQTCPANSGFQIQGFGGGPVCLVFDFDGTFTGNVDISINYDDTGLTLMEEQNLTLQQFNSVTMMYEDKTTSVDTTNNLLNGTTTGFSFFGIFNPIVNGDGPAAIGGEIIPLDTTMVLAAGAQYTAAWMIPAIVSAIGIAIVIARKF